MVTGAFVASEDESKAHAPMDRKALISAEAGFGHKFRLRLGFHPKAITLLCQERGIPEKQN